MTQTLTARRTQRIRSSLLASSLGLGLACAATAAQAAGAFTLPVGTCAPANLVTLQADLKLTNGAVRRAGRNPPGGSRYMCDVPDDFAATPPNTFEFQYIDRNIEGNGNLSARLMRRTRTSGATVTWVRLDSVPSSTLKTLRAPLPGPLDTAHYFFFVIVEMSTDNAQVEAHTVGLTLR